MKARSLLILLLMAAGLLPAHKLQLQKHYQNNPVKRHPHTASLRRGKAEVPNSKDPSYEKLLVILVDFQEEVSDDPLTTGNGKFLLAEDPYYLHPIASPPHDREYFLNNLEALRYYYLAASNGSYNLQYDVYPQDRSAYTLPHSMGYYNPPNASGDLFVSLMEEYFKTAFELADSLSPGIDFAQYGHYMIIHAGSDWQHDIFGDTPSDIPSFFIRAGDGKEAVVDEGTVLIRNACNVPSTISQDFYTQTSDGDTYLGGYGALNAVIAHEFGHSLGLLDLYNVYNWQPMVGVFDIMDSGGSGVLVDQLDDGSYVMVEGVLPVLPGAWSRELIFGDYLQDYGYLKQVDQIDLFTPINLAASSQKQTGNSTTPQILKLPLSPTEYVLVENRNVDPDNDGGTAVFATEDSRVILYPTALNDAQNNPTYEYDYLLPSFQRSDGFAIGGGILVWHINDEVIYDQGVTLSDGSWVSNFDNNSVNRAYTNRGVQIIEADGLPDIGYDWSWYWTGTQYEYFHKYKPVLDGNGFFVNWSQNLWKPTLSSSSEPPLLDSDGFGVQYWLDSIGNPAADMALTIRSGMFASTQIEDFADSALLPGPVINSSFSERNLPLLGSDSIRLLSNDGNQWQDLMGAFSWQGQPLDQPLVSCDQDANGFDELVLVHGSTVELVEFAQDALQSVFINYPDPVTCAPLSLNDTLFVSTQSGLSTIRENAVGTSIQIVGIQRLGTYAGKVAALSSTALYLAEPEDLELLAVEGLPEAFGDYEPVSFNAQNDQVAMLFLMANNGNIYRYQDGQLSKIFTNTSLHKPTQMGLTWYPHNGQAINPTLFFGCGSKIFALKADGTIIGGYPFDASPLIFAAQEHVYALASYPRVYFYLPVPGRGHVAYEPSERIAWQKSFLTDQTVSGSRLWTGPNDPESGYLYWCYTDEEGKLFIHSASVYMLNEGIYWNGFRNGGSGCFEGWALEDEQPSGNAFDAYVYPNPVRRDAFRVRIENFSAELKLDIFDIRAKLVQSHSIPADGHLIRDLELDSGKLASGVYILNLQCGDNKKRIKFAVEK